METEYRTARKFAELPGLAFAWKNIIYCYAFLKFITSRFLLKFRHNLLRGESQSTYFRTHTCCSWNDGLKAYSYLEAVVSPSGESDTLKIDQILNLAQYLSSTP